MCSGTCVSICSQVCKCVDGLSMWEYTCVCVCVCVCVWTLAPLLFSTASTSGRTLPAQDPPSTPQMTHSRDPIIIESI